MRAIISKTYGESEVASNASIPAPGPKQVRVRQVYSSIGAGDALVAAGRPRLFRPVFSLMLRPPILGRDVAGIVEAVGEGVTSVAVGDRVVGEAGQAWGELVVVGEGALARVPDSVSLRDATTLAVSGITALQGIRKAGEMKAGSRVLVVGASGGVGHLAVQIAATLGATVTGVCSGAKAERVRQAGAVHIIDYAGASYVDVPERFDVVFDLVGDRSISDCLRLLTADGVYVSSAGSNGGSWLGPLPRMLQAALRGLFDRRIRVLAAEARSADFHTLLAMVAEGQLRPWIGEELGLADVPDAVKRQLAGEVSGKTVIRFGSGSEEREPML